MKTFLSTLQGKVISSLVVIALVLGIVAEVIAIDTSYYGLRKARCDASISASEAQSKGMSWSNIGRGTNIQQAYLDDCLMGAEDIKIEAKTRPVSKPDQILDEARAAIEAAKKQYVKPMPAQAAPDATENINGQLILCE
jgi:hypothetical protein